MDIIQVKHNSNLFWLGRYTERVYTTLLTFFDYYDLMLDKDKDCYKIFLGKLGIYDKYGDFESFVRGYIFDEGQGGEGLGDAFTVHSAFRFAYDNAMVIRNVIGSESLAYIHLALDAFLFSRKAGNLRLALMPAIDYIVAFWGSIDDKFAIGETGTILKCGKLVERLDLYVRFSYNNENIKNECQNLMYVTRHTHRRDAPYSCNTEQIPVLLGVLENYPERVDEALGCLSRLFEVKEA
jgi:uncharacterized alpha-E superfamily protein